MLLSTFAILLYIHMNIDSIFNIVILIFSVVIHEVSHGWAARALGDKTAEYEGRLTLNPLKHIDPFGSVILPLLLYLSHASFLIGWAKPVPYNPYNFREEWRKWGDAVVALAGPASNIFIALLFGLGLRFLYPVVSISDQIVQVVASIVFINIVLALFNLVPVPPLDGSKILFAFIPYKYRTFTYQLERFSLPIAIIFMFFVWPLISPYIIHVFYFIVGIQ